MVDFGPDALDLASDFVAQVVPLQSQASKVEHSTSPTQDCKQLVNEKNEI